MHQKSVDGASNGLGALQPLPAYDYDSSEVASKVCSIDGFLDFDTNRYSVPYEYVADIVPRKATEHEVFIYSPEIELVAQHERCPHGAGNTVEKPEHRGSKKIRYGLEPVRDAFLALGDGAEAFLAGRKETYPRNAGFHARFILHLKDSRLPERKLLSDFDFTFQKGIDQNRIMDLATLSFVVLFPTI